MHYKNITLDSSMYKSKGGICGAIAELESGNEIGDCLRGLDAYQRQLKRFDIRIGGTESSRLSEFFACDQSAILFPEYVMRAVSRNGSNTNILSEIVMSKSNDIDLSYCSITTYDDGLPGDDEYQMSGQLPLCVDISSADDKTPMKKRGRILRMTYDGVKDQRLDLFTVVLQQIGNTIDQCFVADAIATLINSKPATLQTHDRRVQYSDIVDIWSMFDGFNLNLILASPDMAADLMLLNEFTHVEGEASFGGLPLLTPMRLKLIKNSAVPKGTIIGIDYNYALEMISAGGFEVEIDKLIAKQFERSAITAIRGFNVVFKDAIKILQRRQV